MTTPHSPAPTLDDVWRAFIETDRLLKESAQETDRLLKESAQETDRRIQNPLAALCRLSGTGGRRRDGRTPAG